MSPGIDTVQGSSVRNGVRQGGILSPNLFNLYTKDLLQELMKSKYGCSINGYYYGVLVYSDDVILLAPCRDAIENMLKITQTYADEHNIIFSTNEVAEKSKSKCILF